MQVENNRKKITWLIIKKIQHKKFGSEEKKMLHEWMAGSPENRELANNLCDPTYLMRELLEYDKIDGSGIWEDLAKNIPALRDLPPDL